jgi:hypothetical protein
MSPAAWKAIIGHAMTCKVGDALYLYEIKENNMGLFFDAILQLVGVKSGDCYKPVDQLDQVEKVMYIPTLLMFEFFSLIL